MWPIQLQPFRPYWRCHQCRKPPVDVLLLLISNQWAARVSPSNSYDGLASFASGKTFLITLQPLATRSTTWWIGSDFFFDLGIVGVGYLGKLALGKKLHTHKCMFIDYVDYVPTCSYSILTKFDIEIKHVSTLHCLRGWSYAFCTSHGIVCGSSIICVSLDWHE